jgi:hypothetical protein
MASVACIVPPAVVASQASMVESLVQGVKIRKSAHTMNNGKGRAFSFFSFKERREWVSKAATPLNEEAVMGLGPSSSVHRFGCHKNRDHL